MIRVLHIQIKYFRFFCIQNFMRDHFLPLMRKIMFQVHFLTKYEKCTPNFFIGVVKA